jgi:hypothetical protein
MKEKIIYCNKTIYNINYASSKLEYYEITKNTWNIWDKSKRIEERNKKIEERNKKIDQILL